MKSGAVMNIFIVAVPLFDANMAVHGYRLVNQSAEKMLNVKNDFRGRNEGFLSPGLDLIEQVGPEPFSVDLPLFVDINRFQLMRGEPSMRKIPAERLVCSIPGGLPAEADLLQHCSKLREMGYSLALDAFPLNGMQSPFFELVQYLVVNEKDPRLEGIVKNMTAHFPNVKLIIEDVPSTASYSSLSTAEATKTALFAGQFYSQPITENTTPLSPMKVNALQLLRDVNTEDFDLNEVATIIARDPALSISLLRFINSGAVNLSRKVDSIQNAVAILGQQEMRRWATVAISVSMADDRPSEITRISLIRAKFAENLAGAFELGVFQPALFTVGLFSLLDVILQQPMASAMAELGLDVRVQQALVDKAGPLYPVMELINAYEHTDWGKVSILMIQRNLDPKAIGTAFVDALIWYQQLLSILNDEDRPQQEDAPPAE